MFGTWLRNQNKKLRDMIWVGMAAMCWAIWRCRNDVIFNKLKTNSIMQVIFRGAYWLRFWAPLQHDEQTKDILSSISRRLETIALEVSNKGWKYVYCLI
jgi:RsiW-degrading membrane proteinase PrsW (M82 family)